MVEIKIIERLGRTLLRVEGKNKNNVTIGREIKISTETKSDYLLLARTLQKLGEQMQKDYKG